MEMEIMLRCNLHFSLFNYLHKLVKMWLFKRKEDDSFANEITGKIIG